MNKPLAYMLFCAGLVFGFGLCFVMQRGSPITLTRLLPVAGYLIAFFVWLWIEERVHHGYARRWQDVRRQGKLVFVFARYVLLRGAVLGIFFVVPMYSTIDFQTIVVLTVLVIFLTAALGYREWLDCESQFHAALLRDAANSLKAMRN